MLLQYGARCDQCCSALPPGDTVMAQRASTGSGQRWLFKCGGAGCPDESPPEDDNATRHSSSRRNRRVEDTVSDLEDFIAPDEEYADEFEENDSQEDVDQHEPAPKRRRSLLQEKFRQFDQEFASDDDDRLPSVPSADEEADEEAEDDLIIIGNGSSSSDAICSDESSTCSHVGKLYCCVCCDYFVEDDFSASQRRVATDNERFCLRHTSASSFNSSFKKPELNAVGLRMRPASSSPAIKKASIGNLGSATKISSPAYAALMDPNQRKLSSFLGRQSSSSTPAAKGSMSALKKRSLQGELSASKSTPQSNDSSLRRNRVIVIDDDNDSYKHSDAKINYTNDIIKKNNDRSSESEGEWDEEVPTTPLKNSAKRSKINPKSNTRPAVANKRRTVGGRMTSVDSESESQGDSNSDAEFLSDSSSEVSFSDKSSSDYNQSKNKASKKNRRNGNIRSVEIITSKAPISRRVTRASSSKVPRKINYAVNSDSEDISDDENDVKQSLLSTSQGIKPRIALKKRARSMFESSSDEEKLQLLNETFDNKAVSSDRKIDKKFSALVSQEEEEWQDPNDIQKTRSKQTVSLSATKKTKFILAEDSEKSDDEGEWNG